MKKNHLPYIKWYSSDFLAGVRGLSASQIGIYTILINEMYERTEPLPLNHKRLAWQCGCTQTTFKKTLKMLIEEGKIIIIDDCLWNSRVEKEFENRKKRSATGKGNANTRWKKVNEINDGGMQTVCKDDATAMLYQKPEPDIKDIDKSISQKTDLFDEDNPDKKLNGKQKNDKPKPKRKQQIQTRFPTDQDFPECPEKYQQWAISKNVTEWEHVWKKFFNHHYNKQVGQVSWYRTWQNWISNHVEWGNNNSSNRTGPSNGDDEGTLTRGLKMAIDRCGDRDEEAF